MDGSKVPPRSALTELEAILNSPEVRALIAALEEVRWTGRPGYPIKAMIGMCLAKALYALPTWSRVCRLVSEHEGLQRLFGCAPSQWACYRFARQLRERDGRALQACVDRVIAGLREQHPNMGRDVAIDGSDLPAYACGMRREDEREEPRYSDPDASWGHRSAISTRKGGGYYGYKVHAAVDTATGLPLAWSVQTAKDSEQKQALDLVDTAKGRGFALNTAIMDKGYDAGDLHFWLMQRGIAPVIALKETATVKRGAAEPPHCVHGDWTFAGADYKRRATKWRCPTGGCETKSMWIRADRLHPLIPRESKRFRDLYRKRGAVEREFGRLKHEWSLLPLRVRGLDRVRLHADLTILAKLASALAQNQLAPTAT